MKILKIVSLSVWFVLLTASHILAATFFVNNSTGNDINPGTQTRPWKTIAKVNAANLTAGTIIKFQGGQTFNGSISLNESNCHGTALSPVKITSYGTGTATISSGNSPGISTYNVGGVTIDKLILRGASFMNGVYETSGIQFYTDLPGDVKLDGVIINNVNVSGYGYAGILFLGNNGTTGYKNVRVTNSISHDNGAAGIRFAPAAGTFYPFENVTISYCVAYNIKGIRAWVTGDVDMNGDGIFIGGVNGGSVDHCTTYNNGEDNGSLVGGSYSNWGYNCYLVTWEYNEAYGQKQGFRGNYDSGAFNIAWGSTWCTGQYNYSHNNAGPAWLIDGDAEAPTTNNTVRYNISENDAQVLDQGSIHLHLVTQGVYTGMQFYNNTIFKNVTSPRAGPCVLAATWSGVTPFGSIDVFNNIFLTANGKYHVVAQNPALVYNMLLSANVYWNLDADSNPNAPAFLATWGGQTYTDIELWRTFTGQEPVVNYNLNPGICNPGRGITVRSATRRTASLCTSLRRYYSLNPTLGLVDWAWDPFGYGLGNGDFCDQVVPISIYGGTYDLGALELQPGQNCN